MTILQEYELHSDHLNDRSVISLDNLNHDCMEVIFKLLPLSDLLRLRYLSGSLNNTVLQYLRTSYQKLAFFFDYERSRHESRDNAKTSTSFNPLMVPSAHHVYRRKTIFIKHGRLSTIPWDSSFIRSQSHFRSEDFVYIGWSENSLDRKIDSLVLFLTAHMSEITKLAMLINRQQYFRFVPRLIAPLRKLEVLLIDLTRLPRSLICPGTEVLDAISGLPELECLYLLRSEPSFEVFELDNFRNGIFQTLSSGENFLEVMLGRVRVLHAHGFAFPGGKTFDKIQEISISDQQEDSITKNFFPALEKLLCRAPFPRTFPHLGSSRLSFVNVKVLELYNSNNMIRAVNELPSLEELHCGTVFLTLQGEREGIAEHNRTIARLYSEVHPRKYHKEFEDPRWNVSIRGTSVSGEQMNEYVAMCKVYFRELRMFSNQNPSRVVEFRQ